MSQPFFIEKYNLKMDNKPVYLSCSDEISTIIIEGFNPLLFNPTDAYTFTFSPRHCCGDVVTRLTGSLMEAACPVNFNSPQCIIVEQKSPVRFSFQIGCESLETKLRIGTWSLVVTDSEDVEIFKTNSVFITL